MCTLRRLAGLHAITRNAAQSIDNITDESRVQPDKHSVQQGDVSSGSVATHNGAVQVTRADERGRRLNMQTPASAP